MLEREQTLGIRALKEEDPSYPSAIRQQIPPERQPAVLYLRGADLPEEDQAVAIVGTRNPSELGKNAAASFGSYLATIGVRVISGLARGIDTIAHQKSLAKGTIAILGAGVGEVYPEENQILAEQILASGGSLLSPFPLDQVPLPQNFPERNELIAALSFGVIVIEGAEKSGAAITGRHALAMGKTVVVLSQDYRSDFGKGAIRLQQDGAVMVTREEEAAEALYRRMGGFPRSLPLAEKLPQRKSFSFSEFQAATNRELPEALALLEEAILHGRIERCGNRFRLR